MINYIPPRVLFIIDENKVYKRQIITIRNSIIIASAVKA